MLDEAGEGMMRMAMTELSLSARAYNRILKVSLTIAALRTGRTPESGVVSNLQTTRSSTSEACDDGYEFG